MDLLAKLPSMDESSLTVLHQNAVRLERSGTKAQKSAAAFLLPALDDELAGRRAAKLAASTEKRAAATAKRAASKRSAKTAD